VGLRSRLGTFEDRVDPPATGPRAFASHAGGGMGTGEE
jgi:hypothetical protein